MIFFLFEAPKENWNVISPKLLLDWSALGCHCGEHQKALGIKISLFYM